VILALVSAVLLESYVIACPHSASARYSSLVIEEVKVGHADALIIIIFWVCTAKGLEYYKSCMLF